MSVIMGTHVAWEAMNSHMSDDMGVLHPIITEINLLYGLIPHGH